jgi:hypothetical protein
LRRVHDASFADGERIFENTKDIGAALDLCVEGVQAGLPPVSLRKVL